PLPAWPLRRHPPAFRAKTRSRALPPPRRPPRSRRNAYAIIRRVCRRRHRRRNLIVAERVVAGAGVAEEDRVAHLHRGAVAVRDGGAGVVDPGAFGGDRIADGEWERGEGGDGLLVEAVIAVAEDDGA